MKYAAAVFALVLTGGLLSPVSLIAADSTSSADSIHTPNNDAYTTAPTAAAPATARTSSSSSTSHKTHHRHSKKKTTSSAQPANSTITTPVKPTTPAPNPKAAAGSIVVPGVTDKPGSRSVGDTNLGTQEDHTPGTTGTSGQ